MNKDSNIVQFDKINKMLDYDAAYFKDFGNAAIESFNKYRVDFTNTMQDRNYSGLRKAGHRIKPAAQMIGADQIVSEYQKAKILLENDEPIQKIKKAINKTEDICNQIIKEFQQKIQETT